LCHKAVPEWKRGVADVGFVQVRAPKGSFGLELRVAWMCRGWTLLDKAFNA